MSLNVLKTEGKRLHREVREQTAKYILAGSGVVAGLAWNEAIKALIEHFFPTQSGIIARFLYAIVITIIVVVLSVYLVRIQKEEYVGSNSRSNKA